MPEKDADVQKIMELIQIMKENDLVKIDIQHGGPDFASASRANRRSRRDTSNGFSGPQDPLAFRGPEGCGRGTVEIKSPHGRVLRPRRSDPYVGSPPVEPQTVVCVKP
jgi:hypothetical protein